MINQDELQISAAFYEGLKKHSWPGNVRELQNAVEKIVFTTPEAHFQEETLQKVFQDAVEKDKAEKMMTAPEQSGKKIPFDDMRKLKKTQAETQECKLISELLERYHGNVSAVATEMGISRSTLYRKMKKYLIALPDSK